MKRPQVMIGAVIFAAALVFPLLVSNEYFLQVIFRLFLFATLGLAWNLVGGYTGQLSLGHAAFFGIGAYGLALSTRSSHHGIDDLGQRFDLEGLLQRRPVAIFLR